MTFPITGQDEVAGGQSQPHVPVNAAIRAAIFLSSKVIVAKGTNTPPGSPADGDGYIIGSSPTGAWSGHASDLAYYANGWKFIDPVAGMLFVSQADGKWWQYSSGAWVEIAIAGASATLDTTILADTPTAYWKLDDPSGTTAADSSGNGYNLTYSGSYTLADTAIVPTDDTKRVQFTGATGKASATTKLGTSPPLAGDWTITAIVMPLDVSTNPVRILSLGGAGETEVLNYQFELRISTGMQPQMFWEYSTGTDATASFVMGSANATLQANRPVHIACVKDGTANTLTLYINGSKVSTYSYGNEPTGGTDSAMVTTIGGASSTGTFVAGPVCFFNGSKLSETRIRAHARAAGFIR